MFGNKLALERRRTAKHRSSAEDAFSLCYGLLLGAMFGALAAILLAPEEGASLRRRIKRTAFDLMGVVEEEFAWSAGAGDGTGEESASGQPASAGAGVGSGPGSSDGVTTERVA